mmetsp:Transcript_8390/g.18794  ORF Transcript_8390/g.18794 Transcript_8390/m.18794 type:complete len:409 (+) Transcript_8390:1803-3029(+)
MLISNRIASIVLPLFVPKATQLIVEYSPVNLPSTATAFNIRIIIVGRGRAFQFHWLQTRDWIPPVLTRSSPASLLWRCIAGCSFGAGNGLNHRILWRTAGTSFANARTRWRRRLLFLRIQSSQTGTINLCGSCNLLLILGSDTTLLRLGNPFLLQNTLSFGLLFLLLRISNPASLKFLLLRLVFNTRRAHPFFLRYGHLFQRWIQAKGVILLITIVTQDGLLFAKLVEAVTASAVTTQFDFADIQANRAIKERSRETIQDTNSLGVRHYFFDWLFLLCRLHNTTLFLLFLPLLLFGCLLLTLLLARGRSWSLGNRRSFDHGSLDLHLGNFLRCINIFIVSSSSTITTPSFGGNTFFSGSRLPIRLPIRITHTHLWIKHNWLLPSTLNTSRIRVHDIVFICLKIFRHTA